MKKSLIVIYAIISIIFFATFPSVAKQTVFAASSNRVVFDTTSKVTDNNLVVDVIIQENPGLVGCVLEVFYDNNIFNTPTIQFASNLGLKDLQPESGLLEAGKYRVLYEGLSGINTNDTSTGKLFTLTFNAKSTLQNGTYNITIKPEQNSVYGLSNTNSFVQYSLKNKNLAIQGVINLEINNGTSTIETSYYTQEESSANYTVIIIVAVVAGLLAIGTTVFLLLRRKMTKKSDWELIDN